jgi:hypothetical protein
MCWGSAQAILPRLGVFPAWPRALPAGVVLEVIAVLGGRTLSVKGIAIWKNASPGLIWSV